MEAAQFVRDIKTKVRQKMDATEELQTRRLVADESRRLTPYAFEIKLIKKLKRIYEHASQMTKYVIPKSKPDSKKAMTWVH